MIEKKQLQNIIEGALLAYGQPLSLDKLQALFVTEMTENDEGEPVPSQVQVEKAEIIAALEAIEIACEGRGYELKTVASGWRFQVRQETAPWVNKLWDEKPQRYSRALMETIAIIAYRQPITRGDIEEIRGVAVSSNIIKTLSEREWVKVIGHRDVPGRPALYATTKIFLDYFNLHSLDQLPSLQELTDIESLMPELNLEVVAAATEVANADSLSQAPLSQNNVEQDAADNDSVKSGTVEKEIGIEDKDIGDEYQAMEQELFEQDSGEQNSDERESFEHELPEHEQNVAESNVVDTDTSSDSENDSENENESSPDSSSEQVVH